MTMRIRELVTKKQIAIICALVLFCAGMYFFVQEPKTHQVSLTEQGFSPQTLSISVGDTIVFVNKTGDSFWPASDPHPTHTTLSAFDPGREIKAGESWSYTFTRGGTWRYHDHLRSDFQGVIQVASLGAKKFTSLDCSKVSPEEKAGCFEESIRTAIDTKGLEEAFKVFTHLYATEPKFTELGCHWNAHLLGEAAYGRFSEGGDIVLVPETSYCGYGFFHGFMQRLLTREHDLTKAKAFCEQATKELSKEAPSVRINCYHGIGHGFIEDPTPKELWGKPQAMLNKALPVCRGVSDVPEEREQCFEGAFNAVVSLMEENKSGLSMPVPNPLSFCTTQSEEYHQACYYEFGQKLSRPNGGTLLGLESALTEVPTRNLKRMVIGVVAAGLMQSAVARDDHSYFVDECRSFSGQDFRDTCFSGITGGFRAHGKPTEEWKKALVFCTLPALTEHERGICFDTLIRGSKTIYSASKMADVCKEFSSARVSSEVMSVIKKGCAL